MTNIVFLNHLYHVLSLESFNDIKDHRFLKDNFANIEHKKLKSANSNWEGIYIRGENTYIELFYPQGNKQFRSQGRFGIGLGTDNIRDIDDIYSTLQQNIPNICKHKFTRQIKSQEIDWFKYVTQNDSYISEHMSYWIMEYEENYCNSTNISRKAYNSPFYESDKLFKDITQITIAIELKSQLNFAYILKNLGFKCTESSSTQQTWCNQDFVLNIIPSTHQTIGVQQIIMELNYSTPSQNLKIGQTNLTLKNKLAVWDF